MAEHELFNEYSVAPLYNIKAVVHETGVPADTLRAWERRYGFPSPKRTPGGHRLYSARDIGLVRWLRDRTAEGLSISQAVQLLRMGEQPSSSEPLNQSHDWQRLEQRLYKALSSYNSAAAESVLSSAFQLYPVEEVCLQLLAPVLQQVGVDWWGGKLRLSQQQYASHYLRSKLMGLLISALTERNGGRILIACAPGDQRDIEALLLAILLARRGWDVLFLGPAIPGADLVAISAELNPVLIALTASSEETGQALGELYRQLSQQPHPALLVYLGPAFEHSTRRADLPGHYTGPSVREALEQILQLLAEREPLPGL